MAWGERHGGNGDSSVIRDVYLRVRLDDETGLLVGYEFTDPPTPAPVAPPPLPGPTQPAPAMPAPPIANPTINVPLFIYWLYRKIFGVAEASPTSASE